MDIQLVSRLYQVGLTFPQRKKLKAEDTRQEIFDKIINHMDEHTGSCVAKLQFGNIAGELDDGLVVEVINNDFSGFKGLDHITPLFIMEDVTTALVKALK